MMLLLLGTPQLANGSKVRIESDSRASPEDRQTDSRQTLCRKLFGSLVLQCSIPAARSGSEPLKLSLLGQAFLPRGPQTSHIVANFWKGDASTPQGGRPLGKCPVELVTSFGQVHDQVRYFLTKRIGPSTVAPALLTLVVVLVSDVW